MNGPGASVYKRVRRAGRIAVAAFLVRWTSTSVAARVQTQPPPSRGIHQR